MLEGVVQYGNNSQIQSFQIKQTFDPTVGHSRLRKQKLDVAFYDDKFNEYIVKDIVLSDSQELNDVKLNISAPVTAYQINHGDHTYAKVRFDDNTLRSFKLNLNKISDPLSRSMFWYQLWYHVHDGVFTTNDFVDFTIAQLPYEKSAQSIKKTLMNLRTAV